MFHYTVSYINWRLLPVESFYTTEAGLRSRRAVADITQIHHHVGQLNLILFISIG